MDALLRRRVGEEDEGEVEAVGSPPSVSGAVVVLLLLVAAVGVTVERNDEASGPELRGGGGGREEGEMPTSPVEGPTNVPLSLALYVHWGPMAKVGVAASIPISGTSMLLPFAVVVRCRHRAVASELVRRGRPAAAESLFGGSVQTSMD